MNLSESHTHQDSSPNFESEIETPGLSIDHVALLERIAGVFGISAALRMRALFTDTPHMLESIESDPQAQQQLVDTINEDLSPSESIDIHKFPKLCPDQPDLHKPDKRVNPDLNSILIDTANSLGVTFKTTSGYRKPKKGDSGRHHGDASDIAITINGRELVVTNPEDLKVIQEFTRRFVIFSRERGFTPSVGCANHNHDRLYMHGNHFHYDIAVGNSISSKRGTFWGGSGSTKDVPAPKWLVSVMRNPSVPFMRTPIE